MYVCVILYNYIIYVLLLHFQYNNIASLLGFIHCPTFPSIDVTHYYQLYQLGSGGSTQKAEPVRGVYPKPRSLRNKRPNKLRWDNRFGA